MAESERYASLAALSERITERPSASGVLLATLDAASGAVEAYTGRVFTLASDASSRVFECWRADRVLVDDIGDVTDLAVKLGRPGNFTASTAYWLRPNNALSLGRPYEWVFTDDLFTAASYPSVEVTARWGWPVVPAEVTEATLLVASRLYARRSSPTGVAGFGDYGVVRVTSSDADVARLLDPYTRPSGGW